MPYSQIIQIIVALVLIVGAPATAEPPLTPFMVSCLWGAKLLIWIAIVKWVLSRQRSVTGLNIMVERLQWLSLPLLLIDFYLLDFKGFLPDWQLFKQVSSLVELLGIGLFVLYLMIIWAGYNMEARSRRVSEVELSQELSTRLRLVLPALIPYFFLSFAQDLLALIPYRPLQQMVDTQWFQASTYGLFILIMLVFIPPFLCWAWQCHPLPEGSLRTHIENFLAKVKVRCAQINIWPLKGSMSCTAAVLGIVPWWRYILITPCLIYHLTIREIEAVLAHEITHIRARHLLWYVFFILSFSVVVYSLFDPLWSWCVSRPGIADIILKVQDSPPALVSLLMVIPIGVLLILYFRFLMGYFMRHFERQADLGVFDVHGHPQHLISALEKVGLLAGDIRDQPSWHHFSIAQRVEFLRLASVNPRLRVQYLDALRLKKAAFCVVTGLLVALPMALPVASWKEAAKTNLTTVYVEQLLSHGQRQPELYLILGDLFAKHKKYKKAIEAYEKAMALDPDNADILNNLAWLYATAEDPAFRDPQKALELAQRASMLKTSPYILDTLAESLFINGKIEQAIRVERRAVRLARQQRRYYERQLIRFRDALKKDSLAF